MLRRNPTYLNYDVSSFATDPEAILYIFEKIYKIPWVHVIKLTEEQKPYGKGYSFIILSCFLWSILIK